MQHAKHIFLMTWLLLLLGVLSAFGQLKFRVTDFASDPFDLTARNDQYKKVDGSGSLYAIIKVSGDDLKEYQFNFGNMNHMVEVHEEQLWVYVQKNAKMVTISRSGYSTLRNYDLRTTIEAGKTYVMQLSAQGPVIYTQMVMFKVQPADSRAVVTIKGSEADAVDQMLGSLDASGAVAKNMPYGTYTYRILSENYYPTEGRFTLKDKSQTHIEEVTLRPRFSEVTLTVDGDAEIYVNGERKGTGSWNGPLNAGTHQVECKLANHRSSVQSILVEENISRIFNLKSPERITGVLYVESEPTGAIVKIDETDYGVTPIIIKDVLIGEHIITLCLNGYNNETTNIIVNEQGTTSVSVTLKDKRSDKSFTVNGATFEMKFVEGGRYKRGFKKSRYEPINSVVLNSFYIGQTEVTLALWKALMSNDVHEQELRAKSNKTSLPKDDECPIHFVSWSDCQKFIGRLNQLTGLHFRLPTEAEWEFAARGGNKSMGYKYAGNNDLDNVAWYLSNSDGHVHPVATKQPNELGIYDMCGNVEEWCLDWYDYKYYSHSPQNNPMGPQTSSPAITDRVCRGGSFIDTFPSMFRRDYDKPNGGYYNFTGFRLVLPAE